jgi:Icc-related predicted phosphoesterase
MSENKTFEELFLSECKEQNLKVKELDILLISDVHKSSSFLEKLKEWQLENKKLFDYIICTGDMLNLFLPDNDLNESIAKGEADLSAMISFLENMCLNVIYIPGNHDPKSLFHWKDVPSLTIRSVNVHKRFLKVANDLYIIGLGGSIPNFPATDEVNSEKFVPFESDISKKVLWEGYPYADQYPDSNFFLSDQMFEKDLEEMWSKVKTHIEETNTTPNIKFILLTHHGPYYSSTANMQFKNMWVYMGSKTLQEFLKKNNKEILMNIHGHSHGAQGMHKDLNRIPVVNPGPLVEGKFAVLKLKRDFNDEWIMTKIEFNQLL